MADGDIGGWRITRILNVGRVIRFMKTGAD